MSLLGDMFESAAKSAQRAASFAGDAIAEVSKPAEVPVRPAPPSRPFHCVLAVVKSEGDDTLTCRILKTDGTECAADLTVAKPQELRKSYYNGNTFGGATYTYTDANTRDADGTTQNIIPSYRDDVSHVLICTPPNGTQVTDANGVAVVWLDMNIDARAWADAPA